MNGPKSKFNFLSALHDYTQKSTILACMLIVSTVMTNALKCLYLHWARVRVCFQCVEPGRNQTSAVCEEQQRRAAPATTQTFNTTPGTRGCYVCVLCTWQINILTLWSCTFQGQSMLCGWVWINTCSAQPGWDETSCAVGISNATVTYSAFPFGVIQTLQEIYKRGNIARHSFVLRLDSTLTLYLCICSLKTHTKFA